jgi:hypothetical protein
VRALAEILRQALQRSETQRNAMEATAGQDFDIRDPREWQRLLARSAPNLEAVGATTNSSSAIALKAMPRLSRVVFLNEMARTLHALPQI